MIKDNTDPANTDPSDAVLQIYARHVADGFRVKTQRGWRATSARRAWSGPLDRGGKVKIIEHSETLSERWAADQNRSELIEVAEKVLHGRNATVFEGLVLAPLRGLPKRPIADLAAQFNVPSQRIYRIKDDCIQRVKSELAKVQTERDAQAAVAARPSAKEVFDTCGICGRTYPRNAWPKRRQPCKGHFGDVPASECLIARRTALWHEKIAALAVPENRAEAEAGLVAINSAKEAKTAAYDAHRARLARLEEQEVEAVLRARDEELSALREAMEIDRIFPEN